MLRRIFTFAMIFILGVSAMSAENKMQTKQGTILHCWCWSFKTIEDNIEKISEAGFTAIQTSPANECFVGDNGGLEIMSTKKENGIITISPRIGKLETISLEQETTLSVCAQKQKNSESQ